MYVKELKKIIGILWNTINISLTVLWGSCSDSEEGCPIKAASWSPSVLAGAAVTKEGVVERSLKEPGFPVRVPPSDPQ